MADGDGLENHCGGNVTVGSNPTPSALKAARPRRALHGPQIEPAHRFKHLAASAQPASPVLTQAASPQIVT